MKSRKPRQPKLDGYVVPTSRQTKFKVGDIVVVNISDHSGYSNAEYFRVYHPAYALPYMDGVGVVELYRKNQFSSKYAVRFQDGALIPIDASFLIGPFNSIENAEKYKGTHKRSVSIQSEDMAGFDPDSEVGVNDAIESIFKKNFLDPKIGFVWLDKPVVVKYKKFDVYVLAIKRNNDPENHIGVKLVNDPQSYDQLDNPVRPEFNNVFAFFKVVSKTNRQLQITSVFGKRAGSYFLQVPSFPSWFFSGSYKITNGKIVTPEDLFRVNTEVASFGTNKQITSIRRSFEIYENRKQIKTGFQYFMLFHNIQPGQTVIGKKGDTIELCEDMFGSDFSQISQFTIEGDCTIRYNASTTKINFLPKRITGQVLAITGTILNSLEGLDKTDLSAVEKVQISIGLLKNLQSFPPLLNNKNKFLTVNHVHNLVGIPNELNCEFEIHELDSFYGASNCVLRNNTIIRRAPKDLTGFFKEYEGLQVWNLTDEEIAEQVKYRALSKKLPEIEGIF